MKLKKLPYYKKVKDKLIEIDPAILVDIAADIVSESVFGQFKRFLPSGFKGTYQQGVAGLIAVVANESKGWEEILFQLAKVNRTYIENTSYLKLSREELKREFAKETIPSLHGTGITPEMLIFYHYSKHQFNHEDIPFLIEEWRKADEKVRKEIHDQTTVELQPPLEGSLAEFEINRYTREDGLKNPITHDLAHEVARKLDGVYDERDGTITLKRGTVLYFYLKLKDLIDAEEWYSRTLRLLFRQTAAFNKHVDRIEQIAKEREALKEENLRLKRRIGQIEKEKERLVELKKKKPESAQKENAELRKKLAHALSRIERLEEEIALLEEAKKINEEIEENLPVIAPAKERKAEMPDYGLVVVSGGRWNSRSKGRVEEFFSEYGIEVEFIPAEDTLKKRDRIANADLVIFDSSRHAHKYYAKIKELNANVLHIGKSGVREIKKLFSST